MPMVLGKSQRWRKIAAHGCLIALLALLLFPLAMVISIVNLRLTRVTGGDKR